MQLGVVVVKGLGVAWLLRMEIILCVVEQMLLNRAIRAQISQVSSCPGHEPDRLVVPCWGVTLHVHQSARHCGLGLAMQSFLRSQGWRDRLGELLAEEANETDPL